MKMHNMKLVLVAGMASLALAGCGQVKPGHVGIKINQYGSSAGVSNEVLGVGTYFTPFGTHIEEYPIFTNTYTYTANKNEGKEAVNEEFVFQDKSGLGLSGDVAVSYSVDSTKAAILFQKYRVDTDGIIAGPLRNAIRDSLVTRAAQMNVDEIYGPKKAQLLQDVQADVQKFFAPYGLRVERLYWAGNVRVPDVVLSQINARIANEQQALAAQASVATKQAEAQQKVAEADGEAQSILKVKQALDAAGPNYIKYLTVQKWNGTLPKVQGAGANIINLND